MALQVSDVPIPGYEKVVMAVDPAIGFRSMISIHDLTLGPALGGLRVWPYESEIHALVDVLRLSRGMTYKSAVARTGLGGGKSVILADARRMDRPAIFRAMGSFVETLEGRYITAEDVGTSVEDMKWIRERTNWVTGRDKADGGSGDPSPFTAYGVFLGVKAFVEDALKRKSLKGVKVAIQGVGHVGHFLGRRLRDAGCVLTVCDVDRAKVEAVAKELGAAICSPEEVYGLEVDVYAPCALGATVNDRTLPRFRCRVIAGGANNVLQDPRHGADLMARGIAYAPDYVINAGGVINVSFELAPGGYDEARSTKKVEGIYDTLKKVLALAREKDVTTAAAADLLAEEILAEGRRRKERAAKPGAAARAKAAAKSR
jgi:leucine dehydrogenase